MSIETSIGLGTGQPYPYRHTELVEPDWTRFPGWKDVTADDWASAGQLASTSSGYRAGLLGSIAAACTASYTVALASGAPAS